MRELMLGHVAGKSAQIFPRANIEKVYCRSVDAIITEKQKET